MAEQITFLSLSNSTIGSTSDFHSNVCKLIDGATPAALHIEDLYPAYKTATGTLASVVNRRTAFVSTEALKRADQRRDRGCGTTINVVNAFKNSLVTAKSEAAAFLAPQLAPYRGIGHHEYSKQTAEGRGMIAVLREADNAAAVTLLGLDDEVDALDLAMEQLKADLPDYFELLSLRYIYNKRLDAIGKVIDRSRKVLLKRLDLAWRLVYNALAQNLGYEQRYTISTKIFGEEIAAKFSR